MIHLIQWTTALIGPFYLVLLLGLYVSRRLIPDSQILVEVNEPILMIAAMTCAIAVAGVIVHAG